MGKKKSVTSEVLKGVAIGDLHLDKLVKLIPNINRIIISYCRSILDEAVEQGYDVAVFLGDIFNYMAASEEALKLFLEMLVDYEDSGLALRVIEGNHGYRRNGTGSLSILAMLEDFKLLKQAQLIIEPRCEIIKGIPLVYLPHPYTCLYDLEGKTAILHEMLVESGLVDQLAFDQADTMGCDLTPFLYNSIAFGHFTRSGSMGDNGVKVPTGVKYKKGTDAKYYIVGHLHTPQVNGSTYYPGTFYQTSFGEGETKGYGKFIAKSHGTDDLDFDFKYKQVEVTPPVRLVNIVASKKSHLPKTYEKNTWYKIQTTGDFELPKSVLENPQVVESAPKLVGKGSEQSKSTTGLDFDLEKCLVDFLEKDGLDESQIRQALKMKDKAVSQIGAVL